MTSKTHTRQLFVALAFILSLFLFSDAQAQISIVVGKASAMTASGTELKQMFSGAKANWPGGERVLLVDQSGTKTGKSFYEKFLGMSSSQVHDGWSRLVLTGQMNAPKNYSNDAGVKAAVQGNPYAVGFISTESLDDSVKEIYRIISFGS